MSRHSFSSLRVRFLFLVLLALVPAFVLIVSTAWEQRLTAAASAKEQALKFAREAVQRQRQTVSKTRQILGQLAQNRAANSTKPTICSEFLADQLKQHAHAGYLNFGVIDLDGTLKCSALPFKNPINLSDRTYFRKTVETHDFSIGGYQLGRATGKASINFGYPNFGGDGKLRSVIFAALDLNWLNQTLPPDQISAGWVLTIIDHKGLILSRSAEAEKWVGKIIDQTPLARLILARGGEGTLESPGVDGIDRLNAFSPLVISGQNAVYAVLGISSELAYAQVRWTTVRNVLLLALVAVFVFVIAWVGADLFVLRQVDLLTRAAQRVASGDLSARIAMPDRPGELNQLARSFDDMTESLARQDSELRRANRALNSIRRCNEILARTTDESQLLNQICRAIVEDGGFRYAWIGYAEEDEEKTVRPVAQWGSETFRVNTQKLTWADNERGRGPTGMAIRTGTSSVVRNMQSEPNEASSPTRSSDRGYASSIAVPMISDGKPFGALTLYAAEAAAFDSAEEKLLSELAADLSYGISTLRTRASHRESEERFRLLVASVQDYAIIMLDPSGLVANWNIGTERISGYQADEIIGEHFSRFFTPEDIQAREPEQELRTAEAQGKFEHTGWRVRKDGSRFWASVSITGIRDEAGNLKGFANVTRDLTERKRAEDQLLKFNKDLELHVIERTAQLEAANRAAEAFSYSVSHDLRAPLRSIDGFSLALLEDYADKLDDGGKDYLQRVRASTQHMGRLIDDMLNLSRVTRGEMLREPVDLTGMAQAVAAELQQSAPDREVEFVIADSLTAQGDARLLRIVLDNLLGNAWKYTSKHPRARIEFGFAQNNGQSGYFVRDDGAGFDMAHADKLFGAFQRLHGQTEFPGTGIGLATVQRIMQRHGGRVWAEAQVDKGATFYFTWN